MIRTSLVKNGTASNVMHHGNGRNGSNTENTEIHPGLLTKMKTTNRWMTISIVQLENLLRTLNDEIPWQGSSTKEIRFLSETADEILLSVFTPAAAPREDKRCLQDLQMIAREITHTKPLNIIKTERREGPATQGFSISKNRYLWF